MTQCPFLKEKQKKEEKKRKKKIHPRLYSGRINNHPINGSRSLSTLADIIYCAYTSKHQVPMYVVDE